MDQPPQPTGFPQPPIQPQVVPEPIPPQPRRKSRVLRPAVRGLPAARAGRLAGAERRCCWSPSGCRARLGRRRRPGAGEVLLAMNRYGTRQGGHPLDRGHDPQRRRLLQAADRPCPEGHRGRQSEGDRGPRQLARRHDHRQRLHAPPPPQAGRRHPHSHRGQHGRGRRQRRLLRVDVRRRHARHDLRRADHLDRLDRRDHSALQRRRTDGEMGNPGRRRRQPSPEGRWAASPAK